MQTGLWPILVLGATLFATTHGTDTVSVPVYSSDVAQAQQQVIQQPCLTCGPPAPHIINSDELKASNDRLARKISKDEAKIRYLKRAISRISRANKILRKKVSRRKLPWKKPLNRLRREIARKIASKGVRGPTGPRGRRGTKGPVGKNGPAGARGKTGDRDLEGGVARQVVLDVRARAATEARRAQPVRLEALDVAVAPVVLASLDAVALVASLASLVILVALESLAEVAGLVRLGVADREADPVLVDPVASRPRADDVAFVGPKAHAGGRVHPDPTVDVVLGACAGAAGRAKFP
eukprot:CAMPEP_0117007536 /NCGR_PEP_ID=MMETSP0472-20121206/7384_1 /TAXON_ID=693140 ORGANISM="Tiarina fusus, Strain LIS" /NCGR_SAMPLE_ID=MMETSP0472 /ASSEMBLY_ACC=CAM_ASM_000603 /LENGTH=294 /DNA_ID=CAMNT_0004709339 /DNA_START=9 /DNA_END=891 /DNA_ORIENTATION=-